MNVPPAARAAADRLGCRVEFIRLHWGRHRCLDYVEYESRCPLVDPSRLDEAMALMASLEVPDNATNREVRAVLLAETEQRKAS